MFTVPVAAAFGLLEVAFDAFCAHTSDAAWWFGNVYDAQGNGLNWWR